VLPRRDRKGAFCLGDVDWLISEKLDWGNSFHVMAGFHLREHIHPVRRRDYDPCMFVRDARPLNYHHALDA
jgi:hypothetical protein